MVVEVLEDPAVEALERKVVEEEEKEDQGDGDGDGAVVVVVGDKTQDVEEVAAHDDDDDVEEEGVVVQRGPAVVEAVDVSGIPS